jgi:hypothetical protein
MENRVTPRPQLPQMREPGSPSPQFAPVRAAAPGSVPDAALPARQADPGTFKLGETVFYDLQVYPGPLLKVVAAWPAPAAVNLQA